MVEAGDVELGSNHSYMYVGNCGSLSAVGERSANQQRSLGLICVAYIFVAVDKLYWFVKSCMSGENANDVE